jgi:uncharacterized protein YjbI with pentapeptide repeats
LAARLTAQAQTQFECCDASGNVRSLSDLREILREHRQWIESEKKAGTPANLSAAFLVGANLNVNLSGADLSGASLDGAYLTNAKLDGAYLSGANLTNARLDIANLSGADLYYAKLTNASLIGANLTNARLADANLTDADLYYANLTGAWVGAANFDRAIFEPNSLPTLSEISQAENLELLTYSHNPAALVQLRKQFEDGGLREQERKITYALKRREAELSWREVPR